MVAYRPTEYGGLTAILVFEIGSRTLLHPGIPRGCYDGRAPVRTTGSENGAILGWVGDRHILALYSDPLCYPPRRGGSLAVCRVLRLQGQVLSCIHLLRVYTDGVGPAEIEYVYFHCYKRQAHQRTPRRLTDHAPAQQEVWDVTAETN